LCVVKVEIFLASSWKHSSTTHSQRMFSYLVWRSLRYNQRSSIGSIVFSSCWMVWNQRCMGIHCTSHIWTHSKIEMGISKVNQNSFSCLIHFLH
jgi:hypothetical protein